MAEGSRSPSKTKGPLLRHKTRSPGDTVKESERSLQKLLEDFEDGKLNAFGASQWRILITDLLNFYYYLGNSDMLRKLNEIRDMQERLTLRHFEIDQMRIRHDRLLVVILQPSNQTSSWQ